MKSLIFLLFTLVVACTSLSPSLSPLDHSNAPDGSETIQVVVKPVVTSGIRSEDEQKWGVDLSSYFTAFEVRIINRTNTEITFDPGSARLASVDQKSFSLNEKEAIQYYMNSSGEPVVTLIPKSSAIIEDETKKIRAARVRGGEIESGGKKEGLIFFKKVSPKKCKEVTLELDVAVRESGEKKSFSFPFSCDGTS
ncbi:MAG: hypothetical protein HY282_03650 [Nitrospirae bacterium]|nr:hypothetical protein [Candidatus Manganitrophaceae bacterium]